MGKIRDHSARGGVYSTTYLVARLYSIEYADHVVGVKEKENPQYKILASKFVEGNDLESPRKTGRIILDNTNMVPCKID